jgi:hypothetical protein
MAMGLAMALVISLVLALLMSSVTVVTEGYSLCSVL